VRDQRRLDPEHPPKPPGRKNRKDWCRGKVGVRHEFEIIVPSNAMQWPCREWVYTTGTGREHRHWSCRHAWVCTHCGKHQNRRVTEDECKSIRAKEQV
jgi:hypothetical protein